MKLYVPEIGDKLKLTSDWTFDLHWEHRNQALIEHFFNEKFSWGKEEGPRSVTLPAGTVLTVDRIYIRQGVSEYSSISFYAGIGEGGKGNFGKPKNPRFWATLSDCNNIEFEVEQTASTLKLTYDIREIRDGDYVGYGYSNNTERKTHMAYQGLCYKVVSAKDHEPVLKVKMDADIEWNEKVRSSGLFGKKSYWDGRFRNPIYSLFTMDGEEIGRWKTLASLKKNAKEYVKNKGL
jgi:hypothetical protein